LHFKYGVVGIRPSAKQILEKLRDEYKKDAFHIYFDGNNYSKLHEIYNEDISELVMRRSLTRGEVGCARAHQLAYRQAGDCDWLIVLEDDVSISLELDEIERILASQKMKPTVIHLDDIDKSIKNLEIQKYPANRLPYRTHAYAINATALTIALQHQKEIVSTADWPIQWRHLVQFKCLGNEVFTLRDLGSTIESEREPLQYIANLDFQKFRSSTNLNKMLDRNLSGKRLIAAFYILRRFRVYMRALNKNQPKKIRTSYRSAKSDMH